MSLISGGHRSISVTLLIVLLWEDQTFIGKNTRRLGTVSLVTRHREWAARLPTRTIPELERSSVEGHTEDYVLGRDVTAPKLQIPWLIQDQWATEGSITMTHKIEG
jgi:hypothetical protein